MLVQPIHFPNSYPVKIVSRSVLRAKRIRLCWLALGSAFSLGCASSLTPLLSPTQWETAQNNAPAVEAAQDQSDAPQIAPVAVAANASPGEAKPLEDIVAAVPFDAPDEARIIRTSLPGGAPETVSYPLSLDLKVESGDTLASLLTDAGVSDSEARRLVEAMGKSYNPKRLDAGSTIAVQLDKPAGSDAPLIKSLKLPVSLTASLEATRARDNNFNIRKIDTPLEKRLAHAGGPIESSIYQTGIDTGLPPAMLNEIINAYSYDVDFQREVKQGDRMDVLYERLQTKDGAVAGHGNIVYAELDLGDRELKIYRYADKSGSSDYYNERGESIRKALLRTPINGAKITSGFGMRNHPLLGYTRMHRGVDFGAPIGTPIYAAGDGTVEFVGKKSGYGNYLKLKHNDKYASAYAHISRFASGISPGSHVKQGQIIAYVGMTGMATGPHLHYEILVNNEQVNPANVKFKTGNVLSGKELVAFKQNMQQIERKLASLPRGKTDMAMASVDLSTLKE